MALQRTATHCNTLQLSATTLQHTTLRFSITDSACGFANYSDANAEILTSQPCTDSS